MEPAKTTITKRVLIAEKNYTNEKKRKKNLIDQYLLLVDLQLVLYTKSLLPASIYAVVFLMLCLPPGSFLWINLLCLKFY